MITKYGTLALALLILGCEEPVETKVETPVEKTCEQEEQRIGLLEEALDKCKYIAEHQIEELDDCGYWDEETKDEAEFKEDCKKSRGRLKIVYDSYEGAVSGMECEIDY